MLFLAVSLAAVAFAIIALKARYEADAAQFELECSIRRCESLVRRMKDAN